MHVISWELGGRFIILRLNIAEGLNRAALIRALTLAAFPWPVFSPALLQLLLPPYSSV